MTETTETAGPRPKGPDGPPAFRFHNVVAVPPGTSGAHSRPWMMSLAADASGLTMIDQDGGSASAAPWSLVTEAHCGGRVDRPDGVPSLVLSATVAGNHWRWLIPSNQLPPARTIAFNRTLAERCAVAVADRPVSDQSAPEQPVSEQPVSEQPVSEQPVSDQVVPARAVPIQTVSEPSVADRPVSDPTVSDQPAVPPPPPERSVDDVLAWDRPGPDEQGSEAAFSAFAASPPPVRRSAARRAVMAGLTFLWLFVVAALVFELVTGTSGSNSSNSGGQGTSVGERQIASDLNLVAGDFPSGWHKDTSADGPLAGFLGASGGTLTATEKKESAQVTKQFESCMGVSPSADRVFGPAGSVPVASASSPAFASPSATAALEAGSVSSVYQDASQVSADMAFVKRPAFPQCFGTAFGTLLAFGAGQGSGSTAAVPVVQSLTLPQGNGVSAVGVSISVPITSVGGTTPLELSTVFIGGGKAEATLYLYGFPDAFPTTIATTLAATLEHNIALLGSATVA